MDEEKAGHGVIESVAKEFNKFFEKSAEAEREMRTVQLDNKRDVNGRLLPAGELTYGRYLPPV